MNILIVDDEEITIKGINKLIKWEQIGVAKVMEAFSGEEALIKSRTERVDIIISDIRMAGMTGIELAKNIREKYPLCQIIFISGHVENEYLKEAIDLEVVGFIEKPIHVKEIEEAVKKAINKLESMQFHSEVKRQMDLENKNYVMYELAKELIEPVANRDKILKNINWLGLDWKNKERICAAIFTVNKESNRNIEKVMSALDCCFSEIEHIHFIKDSTHIIFFMAYQSNEEETLREVVKKSRDFVSVDRTYMICGVFGSTTTDIYKAYKSYESAVIYLQKFFYFGYYQVRCFVKEEEKKLDFDETLMESFVDALKECNREKAHESIKRIYYQLRPQHTVLVSCIKGIYYKLLDYLYEEAEHSFYSKYDSENVRRGILLEKIHSMDTLAECNDYLYEQVEEYYQSAENLAVNNKSIIEIMDFINKSYKMRIFRLVK
ncbi:response regulator [Anaerosporobacter sp.]